MTTTYAEDPTASSADRVRRSTDTRVNLEIDRVTDSNIDHYTGQGRAEIHTRIQALDREWDIERVLEVNAAGLGLTGLVLGATVDRRWLALTGGVLAFMLQHGVQGWCPPLPVLRRLGFRTRDEINREKHALKSALEWP